MTPNVHWPSYIVKQKIYEQKARQGTKGKSKAKALFSNNSRPLPYKTITKKVTVTQKAFQLLYFRFYHDCVFRFAHEKEMFLDWDQD